MSRGIEAGIADVEKYAADNSKGYELAGRDYDIGTDCSGLARRYAAKVEGVPLNQYPDFSTRSMRKTLQKRGWKVIKFSVSAMKRGDLLLKEIPGGTGHVVVYIGDMRIIGAEGNWDGKRGDGDGTEICERNYYTYGYNYILRWDDEAVTDEDIEKIADRVAAKIITGTPIDGNNLYNRVLGIDNLTQANYKELHRTDDPTGRGKEMTTHEHVKWIGASQQDIIEKLDDIKAGVDSIGVLVSKD